MSEAPQLTSNDAERASWCDCDIKREMRQGRNKQGKVWRGEFCVLNECEVLWWRYNSQIGLWITPIYDPNDYRDPQPKEASDERTSDPELLDT